MYAGLLQQMEREKGLIHYCSGGKAYHAGLLGSIKIGRGKSLILFSFLLFFS
jgi:hypothetical protein